MSLVLLAIQLISNIAATKGRWMMEAGRIILSRLFEGRTRNNRFSAPNPHPTPTLSCIEETGFASLIVDVEADE